MTDTPRAHLKTGASTDVQHCKQDALSNREYERLFEATYNLAAPFALQARFVVVTAGRLGLRAGEIAHATEEWVDWQQRRIKIPAHDYCTKARADDSPCSHCLQLAEQQTRVHNENVTERLRCIRDPDSPLTETDFDGSNLTEWDEAAVAEQRWQPKTSAAVRGVPFDFTPRAEMVVEQFFSEYDGWPVSYQLVGRRLSRLAEAADGFDPDDVYPHALRATAASAAAGRGLDTLPLKNFLGWEQLSTAEKYVSGSDTNTQRALRAVHSR